MTEKTGSSTAKTAYGKPLDTPITYSFKWSEYDTPAEVVAAKAEMTLEEQRKTRNAESLANARSKALKSALDDAGIVKPTLENDEQFALREMLKNLMAAKLPDGSKRFTEEQARALASQTLGYTWADESEE